jgi:hypothetical protein
MKEDLKPIIGDENQDGVLCISGISGHYGFRGYL